ncbi:MAG: Stp1/IreP family PP2C-type Ser/Thr phosphatase [Candidatus Palauibacterales bacterium]|nr:Stp1/IreP family PP2C-type Ser/Thr phosphatase [Candidatus Palauibacterales bacterium]
MDDRSWSSAAVSDRGRVRDSNEDSVLELPGDGLFAVADGMGGHAAGEVASRLAVETLEDRLAGDPSLPSAGRMAEAVRDANRSILRDADENPGRSGMGTTLTALALEADGRWRIGHVGDSRAYLYRDGELRQLTTDHSWVGKRVAAGELTREEARRHPMSSVLERALGTSRDVEVDVEEGRAGAGDLFLLCSDGLSDMLPHAELESLLGEHAGAGTDGGPQDLADRLVSAANRAGGGDNITVVLVRLSG